MYHYQVTGMNCRGCINHIEQAIKRTDPQSVIEISLRDGQVKVQSHQSLEHIKELIEQEGYSVVKAEKMS